MNVRFRCPACRFPVYTRRVRCCEKCGQDLPAEFQFSAKELQLLAEEEARLEKVRKEMARERQEWELRHRRGDGG